ncbi:transcriptional regulator [archaeon]|nr:transcriptional regulator [archaeon]|tara:strand:+ start:225 stop:578 length:354 start_codon:yes stop_codon:yes gene_type:complete
MELPQEIEVWYVIPSLRRELAKALMDFGLSQKEVAKKLNLTEPAVSQYLSGKRGKDVVFSQEVLKKIKNAAQRIKSSTSKLTTNKEIFKLTELVRKTCLCKIHKGLDKERRSCSICK